MTATTLTAQGGGTLTPVGIASGTAQADGYFVQWVSGAAANASAGLVGPFTQTEARYHPILTALIRTGTTISSQRIWVALASEDLSQSDGIGAVATKYIGLRYSTSAGDLDWQLASGDGNSGSVNDTGIVVKPNTAYLIQLNWSVDGQLTCLINNVSSAAKTTQLNTGGVANLGVDCVSTTLNAVPAVQSTAYIGLRYDGNNF
jgi:hypothetical protein